ncbi:MAG: dihydrodipicolinate synthase family protein [Pseudodesulfovibrio sp.]|uniref:dihydrodipicolinate synthase family protein n=1 Tax=Pseudodesulfovibrio sp. TaxID=2035812 RepID=UPI003D10E15F
MYKGIYTAIATLFDADGAVDEAANARLVDSLIEAGTDGALFLGSTGEFFNMNLEEKKRHFSFIADHAKGRFSLFAGTGGMDVRETIELTRHVQECGFDAAVVMCPYYFNLPESHIRDYFSRVAASTDMDILLYNFPARNGVTYSPEMIRSLVGEHKNIVGIKDSGSTLEDMRRYISEVADVVGDFSVFSGFDEFLVPNLLFGGAGTIGALPNIEPALFVRLRKAVLEGDLDTVRACQKRVGRLMKLYGVTNPFVAAVKYAIGLKVVPTHAAMRFSSVRITEAEMAAVKEIIA